MKLVSGTYVLRQKYIDTKPVRIGEDGSSSVEISEKTRELLAGSSTFVFLRARRAGLIGWLMSVMGVGNEREIAVTPTHVLSRHVSVVRQGTTTIPLTEVASFSTGLERPIGALVAWLVTGFMLAYVIISMAQVEGSPGDGMKPAFFLFVACLLIGLLVFALRRRFYVMIRSSGDTSDYLYLGPSVIEGHSLTAADLEKIHPILLALKRAAQKG
jgi:hypothetical protein